MPHRLLFLLVLALAGPAVADEADCPAPSGPLDLAAVVAQALCRNPDSRSAWLNVLAQQSRLDAATAAYYPTLDASAGLTRYTGDAAVPGAQDRSSAQLSLNWLLYDFGGRGADRRQAQRTLAALQASRDAATQGVLQQAVNAYYDWYAADAALTAAQASEDAAKETLRAAEIRQKVGAATLADVLQARTALSQATLAVIQKDGARETARGSVALALGLRAPSRLTLLAPADTLPANLSPPAFEALDAALALQRPDLRAQQLTVEAAKAARDSAAAAGRPQISAFADDGLSRYRSQSGTSESGSIGVQVTAPLFAGGRYRAQATLAERQFELAQTEYTRQLLAASSDLWTAWQQMRTAAATVGATRDLVASASESYRATLARYKAGLGSLIDLLTAQSALADARQQESTARFDWHRARIALARSAGMLGMTTLGTDMEKPQ
jgi:outer membrane protein